MFHVKHFGLVEDKNLTRRHTRCCLRGVEWRRKPVFLAVKPHGLDEIGMISAWFCGAWDISRESSVLRRYRHFIYRDISSFETTMLLRPKDLDENTILDLDADGHVCAITFEHASERTNVHHLTG
jgi:hypothetical protein